MTKWEFHSLLGDEAIERSYDLEELENDLNTLSNRKLGQGAFTGMLKA